MRVGIGFDVHAFDPSRPLVLGGVPIDDAPGLAGWSDADVLAHAIIDALLGAARLGDLGTHFSEDSVEEGVSSLELLERTKLLIDRAGLRVENIDTVVVAQDVRLTSYRAAMEERIARALHIQAAQVSVKATTTDRLGFTGRGEGMASWAVALLG